MVRLSRLLAVLALLVAAPALTASPALARKRDHDRLPTAGRSGITSTSRRTTPAATATATAAGLVLVGIELVGSDQP